MYQQTVVIQPRRNRRTEEQKNNLEEIEKFLKTYNLSRLNHDAIGNLNRY